MRNFDEASMYASDNEVERSLRADKDGEALASMLARMDAALELARRKQRELSEPELFKKFDAVADAFGQTQEALKLLWKGFQPGGAPRRLERW